RARAVPARGCAPPRGPGSDRSHRPSVLVLGTQGGRPPRPTPTDRLSTAASVAIKRRAPGRSSETGIHALCDLRPRRGSPVRALVDEAVAARHNRAMAEAMELQWVSLEPSPVIERSEERRVGKECRAGGEGDGG